MIHRARNSRMIRFLCGFLALYLLNISIDSPDPNPETIPEDLSINDQESILELVIEKVMGYENAVAEYDDHDPNPETSLKKGLSVDHFVLSSCHLKTGRTTFFDLDKTNAFYSERFPKIYLEIFSPPPQA